MSDSRVGASGIARLIQSPSQSTVHFGLNGSVGASRRLPGVGLQVWIRCDGRGDLQLHPCIFGLRDLTPGIALVQKVERLPARSEVKLPMDPVGIAPVSKAREHDEYDS